MPISEVWHGDKLNKEVPLDQLCPHFVDATGCYFYVNEFAQLCNGQYIIPKRWRLHDDGEVWADAYLVTRHEADGPYTVNDQRMEFVKATDLENNFGLLLERGEIPTCDGKSVNFIFRTRLSKF